MAEITGIDHIYIAVSDLARSERFYDTVLIQVLGFKKNNFSLKRVDHIQYFNRHFGYVLRPSRSAENRSPDATGLHHFCFRVASIAEVGEVAEALRANGIAASESKCFDEYAPDYWATFFKDPDGIQLEVTNYRQERRERNENWSN